LEIPPLQLRSEDIPMMAEHFAHLFNPGVRLSPGVLTLLQQYSWPGNIRELANVMRRAVVMCPDDTILPGHLNNRFLTADASSEAASKPGFFGASEFLLASELFKERLQGTTILEKLSHTELDRLLNALRGIETAALSILRASGASSIAQRGLKETEAENIKNALELHQWNITEAARALGIGRNTLYRKIKQYKFTH